MTDLSCACAVFGEDEEGPFEPCTAQATQEDLLCDECRTWRTWLGHHLSGSPEGGTVLCFSQAIGHYADGEGPHYTKTDEDAFAATRTNDHSGITAYLP